MSLKRGVALQEILNRSSAKIVPKVLKQKPFCKRTQENDTRLTSQ
jgi:hypothetical protein